MAYYETGVIRKGGEVGFWHDNKNTVASDRGKTHHVLYHTYDEKIEKAKALLGQGFESKPLESDVVIFLTQTEADALVAHKLAVAKSD